MRPWTAFTEIVSSTGLLGLQWGHGLAAVDGAPRGRGRHHPRRASMGPRPCGRGRSGTPASTRCRLKLQWGHGLAAVDGSICECYHAAGEQLQWGHGLAAVDGGTPAREHNHNHRLQWGHGLAAVDGTKSRRGTVPTVELQWGHGLAAVDGPSVRQVRGARGAASMGPRPCGRGRWRAGARTGRGASFNGATALRPWTDARPLGLRVGSGASMGPRPCGRGRRQVNVGIEKVGSFNGATALRPWTARCRAGRRRRKTRASMGPRPCGRGRV